MLLARLVRGESADTTRLVLTVNKPRLKTRVDQPSLFDRHQQHVVATCCFGQVSPQVKNINFDEKILNITEDLYQKNSLSLVLKISIWLLCLSFISLSMFTVYLWSVSLFLQIRDKKIVLFTLCWTGSHGAVLKRAYNRILLFLTRLVVKEKSKRVWNAWKKTVKN